MRRTRPLAVAVSLGIAAALVASAPATAAPKAEAAISKAAIAQNAKVINQIRAANRSHSILRARVIVCSRANAPGSAALKARARIEVKRSNALRLNAILGLRRTNPTTTLVRKRVLITRAVRGLATVSRLCANARRAAERGDTVVVTVPGPAAPGAPAGTATQTAPVTLGDLLGLGRTFPAGLIPETLQIVDGIVPGVTDLSNGVLAIEPDKLQAALDELVAGALPKCGLLDLGCLLNATVATVSGLLANVESVLASGDISRLFATQNLGGNIVGIVPAGPLAELLDALPIEELERVLGSEIGVLTVLQNPL